jgi:hypothetical protein
MPVKTLCLGLSWWFSPCPVVTEITHSHVYTRAMVCSFVSFTYYLSYIEEMDSNEDTPLTLPFALFVSLSQLIIVI